MPANPPVMQAIIQDGYGAPERVLRLAETAVPSISAGEVLVQGAGHQRQHPGLGHRRRSTVRGPPGHRAAQAQAPGPRQRPRGRGAGRRPARHRPRARRRGFRVHRGPGQRLRAVRRRAGGTQLARTPAGLSFTDAAASVMCGLTALVAMRDVARVSAGTRVLVNGASGGVGTMAVQVAKALGAEVTGVCGTGNTELVRSLGADHLHRLHQGRLHPEQPAFRRHPRQRAEPPAQGRRASAGARRDVHPEQPRLHRRPFRGPSRWRGQS